jgi:hypothetical protein
VFNGSPPKLVVNSVALLMEFFRNNN